MVRRTLSLGILLAIPAALIACGGTSVVLEPNNDDAKTEPAPAANVPPTPVVEDEPPPPVVTTDAGSDAAKPAKPKPGPLSFGMCAVSAACDASPVGTWEFTDGCIEDLIAPVREQCAGIRLDSSKGTIAGTVTFSDTHVERTLAYLADAKVFVPTGCTQGFACALIGTAIPSSIPGATGKCRNAVGGGGCDCDIHVDKEETSGKVAYTREGGVVTMADGETMQVCAEADTLTVTSETQANLPGGVSTFAKK